MVKKKQVIQSGAWQMLNVCVKVISQFGYYAVMARLLQKSELGVFALLNSFMNFGNMIGDGGMGDALLQRKETEKQHVNAAFFSSMLLAAIIYIAIFILAPFAAEFYNEPQLTSSLRVFSIIFWFAAMYSPSFAMLQKNFRFRKIFIADGVMLLLSNVLGIILAYKGFGVMSLVWSQIFYFGAELLTLLFYYPLRLKLGFTKKHWKDLIGYGSGLTLIRVNNYIVNFGIILEVGKLVSAAVLGVFDRSFRIMNIPQRFFYDMVQRVMMPAMVKKNDNEKGTYKVFSKSLSLINSALVPLTVFLIIFSKQVVLILLGRKWLDAVPLLQVFFLNLPLRTTSSLGDTLMRVHGLIRLNLIRKVQNSVIICVLIYIGYVSAGLTGISWSIFVSTLISYVIMIAIVRKRIFQNDWKTLVFRPYYNGVLLSIGWVIPAYLLYRLLHIFIADEIIAFSALCTVVGAAALVAFIKKPKLLGSDIVYIQKDFLQMFKKKKKKQKGQPIITDEEQ
ncbi:lipopolysaccharide biosynthesis protein [Parafilimonas sp.]|uniref:lipopolysaccharide biosynthesis protein n=1 Tax=Parafilimonas sp. TaxID=1969739 RepID=UPI003F7DFF2D